MNKTSLEQIIEESARLFAQKGYFGASMDDIAQAVGVRKSSLYHHIRSKESILQWIVSEAMVKNLDAMRPILADETTSYADKLKALVAAHLRIGAANSNEITVLLHGFRALAPNAQEPLVAQMREYEEGFMGIIRGGMAAGEFRQVDVKLIAYDILGRLNWVFRWYHPGGRLSLDEIANALTDATLHGIVAGKR